MTLPTERGFYEPTHRDDIYIAPEARVIRVPWYFTGEYFLNGAGIRVDDLTDWHLTRLVPLTDEDRDLILLWKRDAGRHGLPMGMRDDALADRLASKAAVQ